MNRREISEMAKRWTDNEESWDGKPTEELLAEFGATVARIVRYEERDAKLALATQLEAAKERERLGLGRLQVGPAGIPPPRKLRARAAALERKEHRR